MVDGPCELIALCLGFIGLVGTSATTGMPMWRVTAFIQENIITMETRWEGLWMNCFRQANIRMQCKVYDSLLYLPPELQAARGLMCCSVALCCLAFLVALPGLSGTACLREQPRIKSLLIVVAGVMQILASLSVLIPVSWTAHVIIQDFYNPLLLDAQRRELGEALYIGWVTSAILFASGIIFLACHPTSHYGSYPAYRPVYKTNGMTRSQLLPMSSPLSTVSSLPQQALPPSHGIPPQPPSGSVYSPVAVGPSGQPLLYTAQLPPVVPLLPQHHSSTHGSHHNSTFRNSHPSVLYTSVTPGYTSNPYNSNASAHPIQHTPVLYGYGNHGTVAHNSDSLSSSGLRI